MTRAKLAIGAVLLAISTLALRAWGDAGLQTAVDALLSLCGHAGPGRF